MYENGKSRMSRRFLVPLWGRAAVLLLVLVGATFSAQAQGQSALRKKVDRAVAKVYPALVRIHVVTAMYNQGREMKFEAAGSGAIISKEGYVVTNHHVVGKAKRIRCTLVNGEVLEARRIGTDALADIAVVKLDLSGRKDPGAPLPVAQWGDSDKLKVGDRVLAMGSPVALSQSVTMGIVSNTHLTVPKLFWPFTFKLDGEEVGTLVKWIGHDAAIYGGNSGGPLVNLKGKIVGINEISIGLGGAIPSKLARRVAKEIIQYGRSRYSWIGIRCRPLLKGSGRKKGALIGEVTKGSPAAKAGLQPGDILLKYNGKETNVRLPVEIPDFNALVLFTPVGKKVKVEVLRNGRKKKFELTTVRREPARGKDRELKSWGLTARSITTLMARELKRKDKKGVFVSSVRPGGPSGEAKPALAGGDVIVGVGGVEIQSLSHLRKVTAGIVKGREKPVPTVVLFERKGEQLMSVVKLGIQKDQEKPREVRKAWLPAAYQVLSADLAKALKLKGAGGVRITQVFPHSTAEKAGLKAGDIITHLDGERIQASQPEDIEVFAQMIREYKIGGEAELTVRRAPEYKKRKISVKLIERPKPAARVKKYKDQNFNFAVRDVTYMDRVRKRWGEGQKGALVTTVPPGGWAALAHLAVGDLILAVDGQPVGNVEALEKRMKSLAKEKPRHVTFFVRRGIHTVFVELEPAWPGK